MVSGDIGEVLTKEYVNPGQYDEPVRATETDVYFYVWMRVKEINFD